MSDTYLNFANSALVARMVRLLMALAPSATLLQTSSTTTLINGYLHALES